MEKLEGKSIDYINENIEKIANLFPECVVYDEESNLTSNSKKIDINKLNALLGNLSVDNEKYEFTWNGKYKAIKISQTPSNNTLIPVKSTTSDWNDTSNIYIEGDNLEALKLLGKTYTGKIKMIYIDPPYNTGHDFVYNDSFQTTISDYKELTSTKSNANPEGNGRFHTDWLNMMYPRLISAKKLLTQDGVMFISMADTELKNLLNMCEEIFGKDNIEIFVWKKKGSAGNTEKILGVLTEYIVCCFKDKDKGALNYKKMERTYSYQDEKGPYNLEGIEKTNLGTYARPTMMFEVTDPKTGKSFLPGDELRWTIGKESFDEMLKNGKIFFDYKNNKVKRIKRPEDYEESENVYYNLLLDLGSLSSAKDELELLLGNREIFDTPKPTNLIKHLIEIGSKKDSIILDFFSGSATTAQSIFELNSKDNGSRKFILVQLPELLNEDSEGYKSGYKNICEIGEDRIIKSAEMIHKKNFKLSSQNKIDLGFKIFKLDSTNIIPWDSSIKLNEEGLLALVDVIKDDRSNLDVAYEIMLKYGVFDRTIKEISINNKVMYNVGDGYMIICLDNNTNESDIDEIGKLKPHCVIFKDSGFKNDNVKLNGVKTLKTYGVEDIKSL